MVICFRLLAHLSVLDASREAWTAGNKSATSIAITKMTASSSINVKAGLVVLQVAIVKNVPVWPLKHLEYTCS